MLTNSLISLMLAMGPLWSTGEAQFAPMLPAGTSSKPVVMKHARRYDMTAVLDKRFPVEISYYFRDRALDEVAVGGTGRRSKVFDVEWARVRAEISKNFGAPAERQPDYVERWQTPWGHIVIWSDYEIVFLSSRTDVRARIEQDIQQPAFCHKKPTAR